MKTLGFYLLKGATYPMKFFPLSFHYGMSDCLFVLIYYIARYRRDIASKNIELAFPEKTQKERDAIAKKFYRNLADIFIEALYVKHMSKQEFDKRVRYENIDIFRKYQEKGRSVISVIGHLGNWEFMQGFTSQFDMKTYFVYKKLSSKTFDQFFQYLRSDLGGVPLEMKDTYRQIVHDKKAGNITMTVLIADQRPAPNDLKVWLPFFGHEAPVIMGPERIAKKTDSVVVWGQIVRERRGYFKLRVELITDDAPNTSEMEITKKYFAKLEAAIKEYPDQWLWTHNRWKYSKEEIMNRNLK